MRLQLTDPASGLPSRVVECDSPSAVDAKLDAARRARLAWAARPLADRLGDLRSFIEYFRREKETVARDVTQEMGKPIREARAEVDTLLARAEVLLELAQPALAAEELPGLEGIRRRIEHRPLGLVLDIAAWNYPLIVPVGVVLPALAAGNAVALKHSPKTPGAGEHYARALAGLAQPEVFAHVVLPDSEATALVADARVDHVAFTGSLRTGLHVYRTASEHLAGVGLELGGKDAAYVAADADLEHAAASLVEGACYNAGQSCCAVERVYVHESLWEDFLERARSAMQELRAGPPLAEETTLGPLVEAAALERVRSQIEQAAATGARIVHGGSRIDAGGGNFHEPTLLADCAQSMTVMREETFGPVLPARAVRDDEQALELMNDGEFGLTASVWTEDPERAERFARRLEVGTVYQNRCDYLDPAQPWTGWKHSGLGSTLSKHGFLALTRRQSLHLRR